MMQQQTGAPTMIQYSEFDKAYDYLNGRYSAASFPRFWSLSAGNLGCLVTTLPTDGSGPTTPRTWPGRYLSTQTPLNREQPRMLSTLAHEMATPGSITTSEPQPSGIPQRPVGNQDGIHRVDAE